MTDEDRFRRILAKQVQQSQPDLHMWISRQIRAREKRIAELEHLQKKLYEDYALGRITETRFGKLSASYEQEEAELADARKEVDRTEHSLHW